MKIDWISATKEQKKWLFPHIKRYLKEKRKIWENFLDEVSEGSGITFNSDSDVGNFRGGGISSVKVDVIWQWLERNEPLFVSELARRFEEHFKETASSDRMQSLERRMSWEAFVLEHGKIGEIDVCLGPELISPEEPFEVCPLAAELGHERILPAPSIGSEEEKLQIAKDFVGAYRAIRIEDNFADSKMKLRIQDSYYFELFSEKHGSVIGLECDDHSWYRLLPLNHQEPLFDLTSGKRKFPIDVHGHPMGLKPNYLHDRRYVFVISPSRALGDFAKQVEDPQKIAWSELIDFASKLQKLKIDWELLRLNLVREK